MEFTNQFDADVVQISDKIEQNGIVYRSGYFVVTGYVNYGYEFGKINLIICEDITAPLFLVTLYHTKTFDQSRYCYVVEPKLPISQRICRIDDLSDPIPIDIVKRNSIRFIRMKHYVLPKTQSLRLEDAA